MTIDLMTLRLERALRWSAECHQGQTCRSSPTPYFEHVMAVALVLDRAGFGEDVVIAGLLHDVIEDTEATFEDVAARFGADVAETVRHCSEVKLDASGNKRPWIDRKRDHIAAIAFAPMAAGPSCWPTSCTTLSQWSWICSRDVPSGRSFTPTVCRSSGITEPRSTPADAMTIASGGWPPLARMCSLGSSHLVSDCVARLAHAGRMIRRGSGLRRRRPRG